MKGELLTGITIMNQCTTLKGRGKKYEVDLYANTQLFTLRNIVGVLNDLPAEFVKIAKMGGKQDEISEQDNGKTLRELGIKSGARLTATKLNDDSIKQDPLIGTDGELNPKARVIFEEWFDRFSEDGVMEPKDAAAFIRSCTDDGCRADDGRVKSLFRSYDHDRDGKLTKEEFLEFYLDSCIKKPSVVWSNVTNHNFTNALDKITPTSHQNSDQTALPRYAVAAKEEYFDLLFQVLGLGGDTAAKAWDLLQQLATNPHQYAKLAALELPAGADGSPDWDAFIQTSSIYQLLYSFQIIEALIDDEGEEGAEKVTVHFENKVKTKK